jgi:hypothetical protein
MITKKTIVAIGLLLGMLVFTSACGMIGSLLGGSSSGSISELWSDVPQVQGASKADLQMPLAARLAIQAMLQGRMDFIAYTTSQTPTQVQEFYSRERMSAQGWNNEDVPGCIGDSSSEDMGAICFFGKQDGGRDEGLAIVVAVDEDTRQTQIFYARIDLTEEASN